jgi:hypothetical protein
MNFNENNNAVSIRAFATLEFRDAETDELLRTVTQENSLTHATDLYLSGRHWDYGRGIGLLGSGQPRGDTPYGVGYYLTSSAESLEPCITAVEWSSKSYAIWNRPATYILPNSTQQQWTEIATNTDITDYATPVSVVTKRVRFNQPATTTTIKSIFLCTRTPSYVDPPPSSWIYLTTPCQQLPSEVLDITYRIEIYNSLRSRLVNTNDVLWSEPEYNPAIAKSKWWRYGGNASTWDYNETVDIHTIGSQWHKKPTYTTDYYALCVPSGWSPRPDLSQAASGFDSYSSSTYYTRYNSTTVTATSSLPEASFVGSLTRIGAIYRGFGDRQSDTNNSFNSQIYGWTDFLPKNFAYKPVQPIHNHSELAPRPFVDVDFLASGAGSITVDPGTWTEHNGLLEWWRCDIKTTGQVGTARYFMSRNIRGAFANNTYNVASRSHDNIPILCNGENISTGLSPTNGGISIDAPIMIGSHYRGHRQNVVEWIDTEHVIAHDEFGITIMNLITQDYKNFDTSTTPALTTSSINQITTLNNGDVYIADTVSGLWRISDILGTPTITNVQCNEANIDDTKCYAVSEGYNNSLWVAFEGGLAHTTNGGSSWTTYTVQNGGWVHETLLAAAAEKIETNNWNTIKMIRVDIESPEHKLGIVRASGLYTAMLMWWQPTFPAIDFNKNNRYTDAIFAQLMSAGGRPRTNFFKCSRRGGMWAILNMSTDLSYVTGVLTTHHNSIFGRTQGNSSNYVGYWNQIYQGTQPLKGMCFMYDNSKKPYYVLGETTQGVHYWPGHAKMYTDSGFSPQSFVTRIDAGQGSTYGSIDFIYRGEHIFFTFERAIVENNYKGPGITGGNSRNGGAFTNIMPTRTYYISTTAYTDTNSPATDNWLGRHIATRDMNWNEYRWDGTAWVDGWHQSLNDLTANDNDGLRAGFECESHFFRGRSHINLASVTSEDFSNGLTMVGTFNSSLARPVGQQKRHTMFSTDRFYVGRWDGDETTTPGIIMIKDSDFTNPIYGSTVAGESTRYVITASSVANDSYAFKADPSTRNQGVFMRPVADNFVSSVVQTEMPTGSEYHTIYSPVYTEIDNGDFAIQFKLNIPTTAGPGRGVRVGVRYGSQTFTPIGDTFSASGTAPAGDLHGFRSANAYTVYFAGGTTAPVFWNNGVALTATTNSAITANDQNGTNKIQIRYAISGSNLVITVVRIELAGVPSNTTLYTCTVAGAGTTQAGKPGIIGITPEHTTAISTATNGPSLNNFVLYDYTTSQPFGRTAYTSTVTVYANGSATPVLTYSVGTDNPLNVPATLWCGMDSHAKHRGFRGTLSNPQVWNVAWNTTDVAADFAALGETSVIDTVNAPTANCKARYNMTQSLVETKATHNTVETGAGGMDIQFNNLTADGVSLYAFTNNDFYSWGMFDGLLKDNAITANFSATWFKGCNADIEYTKVVALSDTSTLATTIPSITATPVTEVAVFTATQAFYGPGFLAAGTWSGTGTNYLRGITAQSLPASTDGYFEVGANLRQALFIGLQTNLDGTAYPTSNASATGAFLQLNADGSFNCRVNGGSVLLSPAGTYVLEDKFRIAREDSGTTPAFKFYKNGTLIASTTTGVQTGELAGVVVTQSANPCGVHEAVVNYVRDFPSLEAGQWNLTESLRSGKFAPGFLMLHPAAGMYDVEIDGNPAIVLFSATDSISSLPLPASIPSGTVYILAELGILAFSSADVGKSITINKMPMLYWK